MYRFINALSNFLIPARNAQNESGAVHTLRGMITLIWITDLLIHLSLRFFVSNYPVNIGLHILAFTIGSGICVLINEIRAYKLALFFYILLLVVMVFLPSWLEGKDLDFAYFRFDVGCLLALITAHITLSFADQGSNALKYFSGFIIFIFMIDSILIPLASVQAVGLDFGTYLSFKIHFIFLLLGLFVYHRLVRIAISRPHDG
jgi:hypothetical protein